LQQAGLSIKLFSAVSKGRKEIPQVESFKGRNIT
jgi:hypothetical protein